MVLAYIVAAGMSKIGRREESSREIVAEAFEEVTTVVDPRDIEAVYVGVQSEVYEHQIMYGALVAEALGLLPREAYRVEACAAAGALALHTAVMAVKSGLVDVALAVGVEKMTAKPTEVVTDALMAASDIVDQLSGVTIPAHYAMVGRRYMYLYGATEEDLCEVAVKNHKHAMDNPKAHFKKAVSVEECLKSKPVATPLKLLDSAPISDGAAVAVVASERAARRYTDAPVKVLASTVATDTLSISQRDDIVWPTAVWEAAQRAYRQAGLAPSHIQVAEVHDAFTINEILMYEALGFAKRGEGYKLVREGQTYIGGKIPVNPSGGLKARGHPIGATGLAQIYELYLQLTGRAGRRNTGAEVAMAVNEGGVNSTAVVHILAI
ncbi:MAG: thiolase domain-containing protein [Pyrobaculum sp.]|uniref:thiolase domain-containing protein n=1 Tax=Pyrobaculum sp. TaxID=2004705 RepID=UPI0031644FD1